MFIILCSVEALHPSLQDTVDLLLKDIPSFSNLILAKVEKEVASKLREEEVHESIVDNVHKIFTQADVASPFEELDTEYKQTMYIQRNFGLVVSTKKLIYTVYLCNIVQCMLPKFRSVQ